MSEQFTLQVSDQVLRHVSQIASTTHQAVEEILSELLEQTVAEKPVPLLSDEEVLALTEARLPAEQQEQLKDLLHDHCEGLLNQQKQLERLMNVYERTLLRQSQVLREAVTRGLMKPLSHEQN